MQVHTETALVSDDIDSPNIVIDIENSKLCLKFNANKIFHTILCKDAIIDVINARLSEILLSHVSKMAKMEGKRNEK